MKRLILCLIPFMLILSACGPIQNIIPPQGAPPVIDADESFVEYADEYYEDYVPLEEQLVEQLLPAVVEEEPEPAPAPEPQPASAPEPQTLAVPNPQVGASAAQPTLSWDDIYFNTIPPMEIDLLNDGEIIITVTRKVRIYDLAYDIANNPQGIDAMVGAIRSGRRVTDMLVPSLSHWAEDNEGTSLHIGPLMHVGADGHIVMREPFTLSANLHAEEFLIHDAIVSGLSARGMVPTASATARYVQIGFLGNAIVFADGNSEYIAFLNRGFGWEPGITPHAIYTPHEIASILEQNRDVIVRGGGVIITEEMLNQAK